MKKITKLILALALCMVSMGANAVTVKAIFQTPAANGSWNAETNTYTWTGNTNNLMTMFTFPKGELAMYTKIHLEVAQETHHNFRFCLMNGSTALGEVTCWSSGTKDIIFAEHANTKNVDLSQVTHIAFGGSEAPGEGNSYSCVLTNVYLEGPATGYEVEYEAGTPLSLSSVVSGNTLVSIAGTDETILYAPKVDDVNNQIYSAAISTAMANVVARGDNSTYQFKITDATSEEGLTLPAGVTTVYRIQGFKPNGGVYTGPWYGGDCYLNDIGWTRNVVAKGDAGEDGCFYGISAVEGKENTYKITSYTKAGDVKTENFFGKSEWVFYVLGETIVPEKRVVAANDEIFAMSNFSAGKWTFADPVNLYDWNYLVISTEKTAANASHEIKLTDNSGKTVSGDAYKGDAVGTGAGMWLDRWNSQNIIAIDLNQLRRSNGLDIFNIKSLEITGDIQPSVVYLTDFANPKMTSRGRWDLYVKGDVERTYGETGKFGTICLPYVASYAGAEIYSIVGQGADYIALEKVTGLLEAGKPYFYVSSDENGQNNESAVRNVNFFRADFDTYDAAEPIENNGLIGTFANITAPTGDNYYVLSSNYLYNVDAEATGEKDVTIGANKAYVDMSKISNVAEAKGRMAFINFEGEASGITAVEKDADVNITDGFIYNLRGQRVANPTKGIYIVNGKKVFIK